MCTPGLVCLPSGHHIEGIMLLTECIICLIHQSGILQSFVWLHLEAVHLNK